MFSRNHKASPASLESFSFDSSSDTLSSSQTRVPTSQASFQSQYNYSYYSSAEPQLPVNHASLSESFSTSDYTQVGVHDSALSGSYNSFGSGSDNFHPTPSYYPDGLLDTMSQPEPTPMTGSLSSRSSIPIPTPPIGAWAYPDQEYPEPSQAVNPQPVSYGSSHSQGHVMRWPSQGHGTTSTHSRRKHRNMPNPIPIPKGRARCPYPDCNSTFSRPADVPRHVNSVHEAEKHKTDCPIEGCDRKGAKGFPRVDHRDAHVKKTHGVDMKASGSARSFASSGDTSLRRMGSARSVYSYGADMVPGLMELEQGQSRGASELLSPPMQSHGSYGSMISQAYAADAFDYAPEEYLRVNDDMQFGLECE